MSKSFLLEIGLEELPARFVTPSINQLEEKVAAWLDEKRLQYSDLQAYATPRRLAILISNLDETQPNIEEEAKGPAKKIAYDEEGNWSKAAQGFARGQGVSTDDLFFKELKGVEYIYAHKFIAGKQTMELLPELKEIITSLHFPKNMRWGSHSLKYARPIQWLVALFGNEVVKFSITDIETNNITYGHRFLGRQVKIARPEDYKSLLLEQFVYVDANERKAIIRQQLETIENEKKWVIPVDDDLLDEVHHLVEYPTALFGSFDKEFLSLPKEVLITSMREHQRYFPVEDKAGQLLPYFVTVRNGNRDHLENVAKGNEKVLRARLSDAAFFYAEDQKLAIDDALAQLEQIVYHEELGSIADKVRRVQKGTTIISRLVAVDDKTKQVAERISSIAKFDLVTQMVGEFTELQGRMGEVYAEFAGEEKAVAHGIFEHYKPRYAGDNSPDTLASAIVSMADKLDTIVTCFAIGLVPTGSQDPYALRRQAAGVVQMLRDYELNVTLEQLLVQILDIAEEKKVLKRDREEVKRELQHFFQLRVRAALQEGGMAYDVIDAVLAQVIGHIPTVVKKAQVISERRQKTDFKNMVDALSRVTNISKKATKSGSVLTDLFEKEEEQHLYEACVTLEQAINEALSVGEVNQAIDALSSITPTINTYFDNIMVMSEVHDIRENRLNQMVALASVIQSVANFQELVFTT
ncbi:glycine--tRNA ligase subunit beta [Halalkalibacter sp. APA_J-10(15)]|uniref:glycine--tRNA ligase subunit beta n=1 Tax=unclassified Halalkalibacter TaxID=2893063 RepID=UPI001FF49835|nr:glycine--tRNA ligase subunit beta [Halalkalibacter sp. APA_J-10(15)]MCK0471557.1 glycine--tRNA ligase subunit beta [Halalkalibacter sp. APA_J-10(15)]